MERDGVSAVNTHPDLLSNEDGDLMWLREDLAGDANAVLARVADITGLGPEEMSCYFVNGIVTMREATEEDVEEGRCSAGQLADGWYLTDETGDLSYWKVEA